MKNNKTRIAFGILGWMATAAIPFLGSRWYQEVFIPVSGNIFSGVSPVGITLTLLLVTIISLAVGGWIGYSWNNKTIEKIPKEYQFVTKGAILTRDGKDLCSKCFFQHRREIPLKENQGTNILECISDINHQYSRWS